MVVLLRVRNPRAPMRSNGPVILSRTVFVGRALCSVLGVEVSVSVSQSVIMTCLAKLLTDADWHVDSHVFLIHYRQALEACLFTFDI